MKRSGRRCYSTGRYDASRVTVGSLRTVRIVVSGSHASGKSTLVSDFALAHPAYRVAGDPADLVDEADLASAASFHRQLVVAAERLLELLPGCDVIVERGPIDLLAYLAAATELGRVELTRQTWRSLRDTTAAALAHVDLLVLLPLSERDDIWVPDEEDLPLRAAMDQCLLELCDDAELVGGVGRIVELAGPPQVRLDRLVAHLDRTA